MSQAAQDIEAARRVYAKAIGGPDEEIARRYFESVVERVKREQRK